MTPFPADATSSGAPPGEDPAPQAEAPDNAEHRPREAPAQGQTATRAADAFGTIAAQGLVLLGCGKMGGALLDGWIARGLPPSAITVLDPAPSSRLLEITSRGLRLNVGLPAAPAICLLAVKPQAMDAALPRVAMLGGGATLFISIAAGTPLALLEGVLGTATPIVRAMPNTPAAIGQGITALIGNEAAGESELVQAEALLGAVGATLRLERESQMDAVTAISGSGPAYVFLVIETLTAAGEAHGLAREDARRLALATVAGAGALAAATGEDPATLRRNVTSPGGTTAAALEVLLAEDGLAPLVHRAVAAAARRSRELAG